MLEVNHNPKSAHKAAHEVDVNTVRLQLDRLIAHPLFSNSKRYPVLLSYVVEKTLLGHGSELKERTLGIEVFGRDPNYDANADPVVRITAGEIRKRLAQYYFDPTHTDQLIIELPTGSYYATFRWPEVEEHTPAAITAHAERLDPENSPTLPAQGERRWLLVSGVALLCLALGAAAGYFAKRFEPPPPPTAVERFWAPLVNSNGTATFCLGEPAQNLDISTIESFDKQPNYRNQEPLYFRLHYSGHLALADVVTLTRTVAAFESKHKGFRVVSASQVSFSTLREGPVVLIGAFDNVWTLRLTQKLRFGFDSRDGTALIVDRKSAQQTTWATAWDLPYQKLSRDYAIIARIRDTVTGQPVLIAAGISEEGTESAGETLFNPDYMNELLKNAPANWESKNMEAVIQTDVIEGHAGPPKVLAVEYW